MKLTDKNKIKIYHIIFLCKLPNKIQQLLIIKSKKDYYQNIYNNIIDRYKMRHQNRFQGRPGAQTSLNEFSPLKTEWMRNPQSFIKTENKFDSQGSYTTDQIGGSALFDSELESRGDGDSISRIGNARDKYHHNSSRVTEEDLLREIRTKRSFYDSENRKQEGNFFNNRQLHRPTRNERPASKSSFSDLVKEQNSLRSSGNSQGYESAGSDGDSFRYDENKPQLHNKQPQWSPKQHQNVIVGLQTQSNQPQQLNEQKQRPQTTTLKYPEYERQVQSTTQKRQQYIDSDNQKWQTGRKISQFDPAETGENQRYKNKPQSKPVYQYLIQKQNYNQLNAKQKMQKSTKDKLERNFEKVDKAVFQQAPLEEYPEYQREHVNKLRQRQERNSRSRLSRSGAGGEYESSPSPSRTQAKPDGHEQTRQAMRQQEQDVFVHSLPIKPEHDLYEPPYLRKNDNSKEYAYKVASSSKLKVPQVSSKQESYFQGFRPPYADPDVATGFSGLVAKPSRQYAQETLPAERSRHSVEKNPQSFRKGSGPGDLTDSEFENDSAEFDEGTIRSKGSPRRRDSAINPQALHQKISQKSRMKPTNTTIRVRQGYGNETPQDNTWRNQTSEDVIADNVQKSWDNIQKQIDYDYQMKMKQVSDEAARKLKQYQHEHKTNLINQKRAYEQERQHNQTQKGNQSVDRGDSMRDPQRHPPVRNVFSAQGFHRNERNRFFSPQVRVTKPLIQDEVPVDFSQKQKALDFRIQYENIINSREDIYLIDVLERMNFLSNPNESESRMSLYNFMASSKQNLLIKRGDITTENQENILRNLIQVLSAFVSLQLPDDARYTYLDDFQLQQYLDGINYNRDDTDLIVIDQLSAIKSMINRPSYKLTANQCGIIRKKFHNLAITRTQMHNNYSKQMKQNLKAEAEFETDISEEQNQQLQEQRPNYARPQHQESLQYSDQRQAAPATYGYRPVSPQIQDSGRIDLRQQNQQIQEPKMSYAQVQELYDAFNAIDINHDGTLSRRELKTFLESLNLTVTAHQVNDLLDEFDANGDGVISFSEFKNYLSSQKLLVGQGQRANRMHNQKNQFINKGPYQGVVTENYDNPAKNLSPQRREQKQRQTSPRKHQLSRQQPPQTPINTQFSRLNKNYNGAALTKEQLSEIRIAFGQYDLNNDQALNRRELKNLLKRLGDEVDQTQVDYIIEAADVNKDGLVSFKEFENVAKRGLLPPAHGLQNQVLAQNHSIPAQERSKSLPSSSLLNKREVSQLRKLFDEVDVNGNGTLDKRELRMVLQAHDRALSKSEISDWVNKVDYNGDGVVDFAEFVAAYERQVQGNLSKQQIKDLRRKFNEIDIDKSGTLTRKEIKLLVRNAGFGLSDKEAAEWIKKADTNGDGEIDFNEFVQAFKQKEHHKQQVSKLTFKQIEDLKKNFDDIDIDGDGTLTKRELRIVLKNYGTKKSEIDAWVERADTNGDGVIDFNEFLSAYIQKEDKKLAAQLSYSQIGALKMKFNSLDVDGDGTLSKRELRTLVSQSGLQLSEAAVIDWLNFADTNGDGVIDFNEFIAAYARTAGKQPENQAQATHKPPSDSHEYQARQAQTAPPTHSRDEAHLTDQERYYLKQQEKLRERRQPSPEEKEQILQRDRQERIDRRIPHAQNGLQNPKEELSFRDIFTSKQLDDLRRDFQEMDIDGDGTVTTRELQYFIKKLQGGPQIPQATIAALIRKVDTNGDGTISVEEFDKATRRREQEIRKPVETAKNQLSQQRSDSDFTTSSEEEELLQKPEKQTMSKKVDEMDFDAADNYDNYIKDQALDGNEKESSSQYSQSLKSDPEVRTVTSRSTNQTNKKQRQKWATAKQSRDDRYSDGDKEPICMMEIELDGGKDKQIVKVFKGEKPLDVVDKFSKMYNLSERAQMRLFEQIMNQIEQSK